MKIVKIHFLKKKGVVSIAAQEGLNYHSFLIISYHSYKIAKCQKVFIFFANSIKLNILWDIR